MKGRGLHAIRAATVCIVGLSQPAVANPRCDFIDQMLAGTAEFVIAPELRPNMQCTTSRTLGGQNAQHCRWPFAFRAIEARTAFEELSSHVASCLEPEAVQTNDSPVNHPDTYELRVFSVARGTISVSLKDKGALQQTFVFLRVEASVK